MGDTRANKEVLASLCEAYKYDNWSDGPDGVVALEREALARMSPRWQPIETAPKEGVFQVWLPNPRFGSHVWPMRAGNVKLIGSNFAFDFRAKDAPTYWRPEPTPPSQES